MAHEMNACAKDDVKKISVEIDQRLMVGGLPVCSDKIDFLYDHNDYFTQWLVCLKELKLLLSKFETVLTPAVYNEFISKVLVDLHEKYDFKQAFLRGSFLVPCENAAPASYCVDKVYIVDVDYEYCSNGASIVL